MSQVSGKQIEKWGGDGRDKNINIRYVYEDEPLGTIGAIATINDFGHDYILVTNSDILTNIDYEHFFLTFLKIMLIYLSLQFHMRLIYHMQFLKLTMVV